MAGKTVQIAPGIFWVGIADWQSRLFDSLIPLPYGTSYNSYLVVGREKAALVDTVKRGFDADLIAKISSIIDPHKIQYVVMNHAEPDHAGCIPKILKAAPDASLIATKKGIEMAASFFQVPEDRCRVVKDGDTIDLGGKTLRFHEAPWLHWPETMFTMAAEDSVLFSCDFFGAHIASDNIYDDEVGEMLLPEAKRYYADIMMPYMKMAERGLDKAKELKPRIIAPSHGPVYRNPGRIVDSYEKWIRGPLASKALIVYVSMWGSTDTLAKTIAGAISTEGVEAKLYDLAVSDLSLIASDLVDASAVVVGSPTLLGGLHPVAAHALTLVRALRPRARVGAFCGSYGWGGGAANQAKTILQPLGWEFVGALDIKGCPCDKDLEAAHALGKAVAERVKKDVREHLEKTGAGSN